MIARLGVSVSRRPAVYDVRFGDQFGLFSYMTFTVISTGKPSAGSGFAVLWLA